MLIRYFTFALCLCLGLGLAAAMFLASHENRYYQVLRWKEESERIPESERKAKAKEIAAKVFNRYETLKSLSFEVVCADYWRRHGTLQSRLPLRWWRYKKIATVRMAMTVDNMRTEILVDGKPLYRFFLKDGTFTEFKWPWNGVGGMYTAYPFDPRWFRLCRGVDGHLQCMTGSYRRPWIGGESNKPTWINELKEKGIRTSSKSFWFNWILEEGEWIGSTTVRGESCDVVLNTFDDECLEWDVFYINPEGFMVRRDMINTHPDDRRNKWTMVLDYSHFKTDPIPSIMFSPSEALLETAKSWRKMSEDEALAELKEVKDVDLSE